MRLRQAGVILFVERYDACVAFYEQTLGLEVVLRMPTLTIFAFGDGYLEIEQGGPPAQASKARAVNPVTLRFDVDDLDAASQQLRSSGAVPARHAFDWGEIAVFHDPDGNRCELKRHDPAQTVLARN